MLHHFLSIIFLGLLAGCTASRMSSSNPDLDSEKGEKYHVILMGGQSNMVGVGRVAELETATLPENIQYINFGMSPDFSQDARSFGPEVGLAQVLHRAFPDSNFLLIKYAIGGASLLDWSPDYDSTRAIITGHPHFGNMYDSLWKKVEQVTEGYDSEIAAMLWMQGERDARVPEAGVDYYSRFASFIKAIRRDASRPDLPFIFGLVNPDPRRYVAVDTVQAAQRMIARDISNVRMIDTSDLDKWDDQVHYNTSGQLELGRRFGQALTNVWSSP